MARRGPLTRLAAFLTGGRSLTMVEGGAVAARKQSLDALGGDARGAIFVEYVALLCLVSVGGAAAIVTLGTPLVALARFTQLVIGLPIP